MKKLCGSIANIASWTDQVLTTWAGAASNTEQDVLEFLSALAKANKDILCPAVELRCRLLILRRQAVVDSLPCTFSDRKKHQLLSSPISDVLFLSCGGCQGTGRQAISCPAMCTLFHGAGVNIFSGISLWVSWEQDKSSDEEVYFVVPLRRIRSPSTLLQWDPFGPGILAVADPMAGVDLAREAVCSPVPVGTCLQQQWREWIEVGAGEWVVKTLRYGYVLPFLRPPPLSGGPIESGVLGLSSTRHVSQRGYRACGGQARRLLCRVI
ncbi:hypothetical protein E2C01_054490 [Portunus trituberculatus]|uniref:Uncharacterized protein n=1 Tax=Portunus trituberculatus TaxID=210409 RepID=A0A5B7GST6_PORTR|nr:hypothetical protein [Portunus trituberculatus]